MRALIGPWGMGAQRILHLEETNWSLVRDLVSFPEWPIIELSS